ncbi:SDR family NAD(P)-dependent oxidoreductase [Paenibacillus donghaensis]|nr:SDR family NAD(P)-dependent oxidoreductase [Paenibacillus donghaensis]
MRERKSGHIINLSSVAGHNIYTGGTVYCGTKHAV